MNYKTLFALSILLLALKIDAQNILSEKISQRANFSSCLDYKFEKDQMNCRENVMTNYVKQNKNNDYRSGIVRVEAQIDEAGIINSSKAIDGPEGSIRAEAERLIWALNEWAEELVPAKLEGVPVACQDTFVLNFEKSFSIRRNENSGLEDGGEGDLIFKIVESMPRFPGCEDMEGSHKEKKACADKKMLAYIYRNIKYTAEAKYRRIEGQVIVSFEIETNGAINDAKILRGIDKGLDEEALRVVNKMNDMDESWIPGRQRGQAVRVQYNLPIKFKLPKKRKRSNYRN